MVAVKTRLGRGDIKDPAEIRHGIERRIPMSAGHNNRTLTPTAAPRVAELKALGRRYSRTAARKLFTMKDLETAMRGIEFRHAQELLDEIPFAYKDIDDVIENAKSLIEVKHTLRQFINVKGD